MATQAGDSVGRLTPHVVGNAFAQKYYSILNASPEDAHMFYHDKSILGRPDVDGTLISVTTKRAIKRYYLSTGLKGCPMQIDNVDTQKSHEGGLLVLVAGTFIMADTVNRRFTQSFFLAPQGTEGYFVLNDALRYVPAEPEKPPVMEHGPCQGEHRHYQGEHGPKLPFSDYIIM